MYQIVWEALVLFYFRVKTPVQILVILFPRTQYSIQIIMSPFRLVFIKYCTTQKEITRQTDLYLVILSSKTYVFEDNLTKY